MYKRQAFEDTISKDIDILRVSADVERDQHARLADLRSSRDTAAVEATLARLTEAATTSENLVPLIIDAARAEATEGEIIDALRAVFGEYREVPRF